MAGRALQITYLADAKSVLAAQQQIDAGHSKLEGTTSKVGGVFQSTFGSIIPLATAAAGAAVVKFGVDSVKAASDQGEALNKAKVVFEGASDSVIRFSDNSAKGFGISKTAALDAASGFGAMLQTAGLAEDASASMSVTMTKLAGDMASFNNQDPSEMLERLRSGLAGEAEPLRRFGVFLSEARVQQEAVNLGLVQQGEQLTEAAKVQARYSIILQDTTKQQGDFGRTLGESLPNQIRVAKAEFVDFQAQIGAALLPALTDLLHLGTELARDMGPALALAFGEIGKAAQFVADTADTLTGPLRELLELLPEVGSAGHDGGEGMGVFERGIKSMIGTIIPGSQALFDFEQQEKKTGDAASDQDKELRTLTATYGVFQKGMAESEDKMSNMGNTVKKTTEEIRDQRLAILGLTDSFLGILDSAKDVSEAQRELNRLEEHGKQGTERYKDAVLDAITAQAGLEEAVFSYGKELADSGEKQSKVIGKIKDLASEFGVQKGTVADLIARIRDYINAINDIPKEKTTDLYLVPHRPAPGEHRAQYGFHDVVTSPTLFLAGEAGPERVDITPGGRNGGRSHGSGGGVVIHLSVGTVVGPGGIREVADILRRELLEVGRGNLDIFAGRA